MAAYSLQDQVCLQECLSLLYTIDNNIVKVSIAKSMCSIGHKTVGCGAVHNYFNSGFPVNVSQNLIALQKGKTQANIKIFKDSLLHIFITYTS